MFRYCCVGRPLVSSANLRRLRLSTSTSTGSATSPPPIIKSVRPFQEDFWERNFERLKKHLAQNTEVKDHTLKEWIFRQRAELQKRDAGDLSSLNDNRFQKLCSLDKEYGILAYEKTPWEDRFDELVKFVEKHNGKFPFEMEKDAMTTETQSLAEWCCRQRNVYRMYLKGETNRGVTAERIEKLGKIGFPWHVNEAKWYQKYHELVEYYKIHGDSLVPSAYAKNPALGRWVQLQREKKQTEERAKLLDEVDFVWSLLDYRWMEKYNELKECIAVNGIGKVAGKHSQRHRSLNHWVKHQYKCYNRFVKGETSSMTEHRRQLLEDLGLYYFKKEKVQVQTNNTESITNATKAGADRTPN